MGAAHDKTPAVGRGQRGQKLVRSFQTDSSTLTAPFPTTESQLRKYLSSIARQEKGCWGWTAGRTAQGYGSVRVADRNHTTHRVAWNLAYGPIPVGKHVLHHCDNKVCCNPTHLFLGTNLENSRDRAQKGRSAKHNLGQKLDWTKVDEIKRLWSSGQSGKELAERFGVSRQSIHNVVEGKSWRH